MGGHLRTPGVCGRDHRRDLVGSPRSDAGLRAVEVQLEEVRAIVELTHRQP